MIITVASYKGGVGKTTTAVHLAGYLQTLGKTLLLDGDSTRNATAWYRRADGVDSPGIKYAGFEFRVASIESAARLSRQFAHTVIDTGQRPSNDDLRALAESCDLLVIPAVPSALDTDGLGQTLRALESIGAWNYGVLLTRVEAHAGREVEELRKLLEEARATVFAVQIPELKVFEKAAAAGTLVDKVNERSAERAWAAYVAAGAEAVQLAGKLAVSE